MTKSNNVVTGVAKDLAEQFLIESGAFFTGATRSEIARITQQFEGLVTSGVEKVADKIHTIVSPEALTDVIDGLGERLNNAIDRLQLGEGTLSTLKKMNWNLCKIAKEGATVLFEVFSHTAQESLPNFAKALADMIQSTASFLCDCISYARIRPEAVEKFKEGFKAATEVITRGTEIMEGANTITATGKEVAVAVQEVVEGGVKTIARNGIDAVLKRIIGSKESSISNTEQVLARKEAAANSSPTPNKN